MVERSEAVEVAVRALRHRDRSAAELDERLRARGVEAEDRRDVLGTLEQAGYLDDERFALARAETLARRGAGDAQVRDDLERRGVAAETVAAALEALEPERERAERIASSRGRTPRTARYLAAHGFDGDAIAAAVAPDAADAVE